MDRINGAGHVGRRFVTEDADLGRPPTLITDVWLNLVQEEIVNVILATGATLDGVQEDQLLQAITNLIQASSHTFVSVGGTADAITATYNPAVITLNNGMTLLVRAAAANTLAAPTFQADGSAAATIVKGNNIALVAGDIAGPGHWLELQRDTTLGKWVLQNPATGVSITTTPDASTTVKGKVQLATPAETQTGTDAAKAITADDLAKAMLGGVGQAMVDVTASRALGTNYTNSTGRPIVVYYSGNVSGGGATADAIIDGVSVPLNAFSASGAAGRLGGTFIVPNGKVYSITNVGTINSWREYR